MLNFTNCWQIQITLSTIDILTPFTKVCQISSKNLKVEYMNQSAGAVCIIKYIVSSSTIRENTILKLFNSVRYSQPPNG